MQKQLIIFQYDVKQSEVREKKISKAILIDLIRTSQRYSLVISTYAIKEIKTAGYPILLYVLLAPGYNPMVPA